MTALAGNVQGIMKGEPSPTRVVLPNPNNPADPRNPGYREKALMKRNLMIGGGILLLVGLILMIKKYPKATIGSAAIIFVMAYFFLGIMGPSRYQQWKNRNQQPKMIK